MSPATFSWSGGGGVANPGWNVGANWDGSKAPTGNGTEDLVFPETDGITGQPITQRNTLDNIAGGVFNSITISGGGARGDYLLRGSNTTLTLGNASTFGSGTVTVNGPSGTFATVDPSLNIVLAGPAGSDQFFTVNQGSTLDVKGTIAGSASSSLTKEGTGILRLEGNNINLLGQVKVGTNATVGGIVQVTNANALGSPASTATVSINSQLQLLGNFPSFAKPLILNGTGISQDGALTLGNSTTSGFTTTITSQVQLDINSPAVAIAAAGSVNGGPFSILTIGNSSDQGQISDLGSGQNLIKEGAGQVVFANPLGNTYRGTTAVNNGFLTIQFPHSLGADLLSSPPGGGSPQTGTTVNRSQTETGVLQLQFVPGSIAGTDPNAVLQDPNSPFNAATNPVVGFQVRDELLTLNGDGLPYTDPTTRAVTRGVLQNIGGRNNWAANITLGSPFPEDNITTDVAMGVQAGTELTISGVIGDRADVVADGPFSLTKLGTGRLIFNNANTYTGFTDIQQGALNIRDSQALGSTVDATGTGLATTTLPNGLAVAVIVENGASLEMEVDRGTDAHGRDLTNDSVTGQTGNGSQLGLLVAKPIILNGAGFQNEGAMHSISGINEWTGGVTLGDTAAQVGIGVDPDPHPSNTNLYFTHDYSLTVGSMAVQTIRVPANVGTFTLSFQSVNDPTLPFNSATNPLVTYTTASLPGNATAQQVQDALNALPNIGGVTIGGVSGSVAVTSFRDSSNTAIFTIRFNGALAWQFQFPLTASAGVTPSTILIGGEQPIDQTEILTVLNPGVLNDFRLRFNAPARPGDPANVTSVAVPGEISVGDVTGFLPSGAGAQQIQDALNALQSIGGLGFLNTINGVGASVSVSLIHAASAGFTILDASTGAMAPANQFSITFHGKLQQAPLDAIFNLGFPIDIRVSPAAPPGTTITLGINSPFHGGGGSDNVTQPGIAGEIHDPYLQPGLNTITVSFATLVQTPGVQPASLHKEGAGQLILPNGNSYAGSTVIDSGWITVRNDHSLGDVLVNANTTTNTGGVLNTTSNGNLLTSLPLGDTAQSGTVVMAGAALHLYPLFAQSPSVPSAPLDPTLNPFVVNQQPTINLLENLTLSGEGLSSTSSQFVLITGKGALESLDALNTVGGPIDNQTSDIFLDGTTGQTGLGVEQVFTNDYSLVLPASAPAPTLFSPPTDSQLTVVGSISNAVANRDGGIDKWGSRRLILEGAGSYTGLVSINEGVIRVDNDTALGLKSSGTSSAPTNQNQTYSNTTTSVGGGNSALQSVTVTGSPSGTFQLTFNGDTTDPMLSDPTVTTAAIMQTELNNLPSIKNLGGQVSVNLVGNIYTILFGGTLAGSSQQKLLASVTGGALIDIQVLLDGDGAALELGASIPFTSGGLSAGLNIFNEALNLSNVGNSTVQGISVGGITAGSNYTLSFKGATTSTALTPAATAQQVQDALNALPTIANVVNGTPKGFVTVKQVGNTYLVTFGGVLVGAAQPKIVATPTNGLLVNVQSYSNATFMDDALTVLTNDHLWAGPVHLGVNQAVSVAPSARITFQGQIEDANPNAAGADLTIEGGGEADLSSANINRGTVFVNQGNVTLRNDQALGATGTPEVQVLGLSAFSGLFQLSFKDTLLNGRHTGLTRTLNAASPTLATDIQQALNELPGIGGVGGIVTVTQQTVPTVNGPLPGPVFNITFGGQLAGYDVPALLALDPSNNGPSAVASVLSSGVQTVTLSDTTTGGAPSTGNFTLTFGNATTAPLPATITLQNQTIVQPAYQEAITVSGATTGTFTLGFPDSTGTVPAGNTTAALDFNSTAQQVQDALNLLPLILANGSVNVTLNKTTMNGVPVNIYTVTFLGGLSHTSQPDLVAEGQNGTTATEARVGGVQGALNALANVKNTAGFATVTQALNKNGQTVYTIQFLGKLATQHLPALTAAGAGGTNADVQAALDGLGGTNVSDGAGLNLQGSLSISGEPLVLQGQGTTPLVPTDPNSNASNVPLNWFQVGPGPINNAATGNGNNAAVTGTVESVATDPTDPKVIYIATAGGGAWKTTDGGQTWNPLFDLTADTQSHLQVSVGAGPAGGQPTNGSFTLQFLGSTTAPLPFNATAQQVQAALNSLVTLGGGQGTVVKSTGEVVNGQGSVLVTEAIDPVTRANIYSITFQGNQAQTDIVTATNFTATGANGTTATVLNRVNGFTVQSIMHGGAISVAPSDPRVIYYGTGISHGASDSYYGTGVYRSNDSGRTWVQIVDTGATANAVTGYPGDPGNPSAKAGFNPIYGLGVTRIAVDPFNPNAIYVATGDETINEPALNAVPGATLIPGVYKYIQTPAAFDPTSGNTIPAVGNWVNLTAIPADYTSLNPPGPASRDNLLGQEASIPHTVGPLDDFRFSFPQGPHAPSTTAAGGSLVINLRATWSDVAVVRVQTVTPDPLPGGTPIPTPPGLPANLTPIVYAALGTSTDPLDNSIPFVPALSVPSNAPLPPTFFANAVFHSADAFQASETKDTSWYLGTPATPTDEVQSVTLHNYAPPNGSNGNGTSANGSFVLTYQGPLGSISTVPPIPDVMGNSLAFAGLQASLIQAALNTMFSIYYGMVAQYVTVTVDFVNSTAVDAIFDVTYDILGPGGVQTFTGPLAATPVSLITATTASGAATGFSVDTAEITVGGGFDNRNTGTGPEFSAQPTGGPRTGPIKIVAIAGAGTNPSYPNLPIQTSTTVYALIANPTMPQGFGNVIGTAGTGPTLANSGTFLELEQSTDGGRTWTVLAPAGLNNFLGNQANYDMAFAALSAGQLYVGGSVTAGAATPQLIYSGSGASFSDISLDGSKNGPHTGIHSIAIDPLGRIVVGTDGGVWRFDGTAWSDINGDLDITQFNAIAGNPNNPSIAYGDARWNGTAIGSGGLAWTQAAVGPALGANAALPLDAGPLAVDPSNGNILYRVVNLLIQRDPRTPGGFTISNPVNINGENTPVATLEKSIDAGATWSPILTSAPDRYFPFVVDQHNPLRLVVGNNVFGNFSTPAGVGIGGSLIESLDGGSTYQNLRSPINVRGIALATFQGPFIADTDFPQVTDKGTNAPDPDTIYVTNGNNVFLTKDHGVSWVERDFFATSDFTGGLPGAIQISDIEVDPTNRDSVYVVASNPTGTLVAGSPIGRVFRLTYDSTSKTYSWVDLTGNLANVPVWKIVIDPRDGDLYVGTDQGVFQLTGLNIATTPASLNWIHFGAGLANVAVFDLELNQTTNSLLAGTYGRGMYQLFLTDQQANAGALRTLSGSSIWTGPVELVPSSATTTVNGEAAGVVTISASGTQVLQNGVATALLNILGPISDRDGELTVPNAATLLIGTKGTTTNPGQGDVVFSGTNTYGGITDVRVGSLVVHNPKALGASDPNYDVINNPTNPVTQVEPGAVLELQSDLALETVLLQADGIVFNNHFTGALRNTSNANTFTGTAVLLSNTTVGTDSGTQLTVGDQVQVLTIDPNVMPQTFTLTFSDGTNAQTTRAIRSDSGTLAADIQNALNSLPILNRVGGVTVVQAVSTPDNYTIVFDGGLSHRILPLLVNSQEQTFTVNPQPGQLFDLTFTTPGTGTISSSGTTVTGIGTHFLSEVVPGELVGNAVVGFFSVAAVTSDTMLTLVTGPLTDFSNIIFGVESTTAPLDAGSGTLAQDVANQLNSLPNINPVVTGVGNITSTGMQVTGVGTAFLTQVAVGDLIGNPTSGFFTVTAIQSDTGLTISGVPTNPFTSTAYTITHFPVTVQNSSVTTGSGLISSQGSNITGSAIPGAGTVTSVGTAVTGSGTAFTSQVQVGDQIGNAADGFVTVTSIQDDTHLTLSAAPAVPFNSDSYSITKTHFLTEVQVGDLIGNAASGFFPVTAITDDTHLTIAGTPAIAFVNAAYQIKSNTYVVTFNGLVASAAAVQGSLQAQAVNTGTGTITSAGMSVTGLGTHFTTDVQVGDQIGNASSGFFTVTSVADDTNLMIAGVPAVPFANSVFQIKSTALAGVVTSGPDVVPSPVSIGSGTAGTVTGSKNLTKELTGTLVLATPNTGYNGTTLVNQGALRVEDAQALGTTTKDTEVLDGAQVQIQSGANGNVIVVNEPLVLSGTGIFGTGALLDTGGSNEWAGTISLTSTPGFAPATAPAGAVGFGVSNPLDDLKVSGLISEATLGASKLISGISKVGLGSLTLSAFNTYTGGTYVTQGDIRVQNASSLGTATVNDLQRLSVGGLLSVLTAAGSTFTMTFGGLTTAPLAFNAPASGGPNSVQGALNALSSIAAVGGVTVTSLGTVSQSVPLPTGGTTTQQFTLYSIQFNTATVDQPLITATPSPGLVAVVSAVAEGQVGTLVSPGAAVEVDGTNLQVPEAIGLNGTGLPDVQLINVSLPTGAAGTFTLSFTFNGTTSTTQSLNPLSPTLASDIQNRLNALASIQAAGGVTVVTENGTFVVVFNNPVSANQPLLTSASTPATGGPVVTVSKFRQGGLGALNNVSGSTTSGGNTWTGPIVLITDSSIGASPSTELQVSGPAAVVQNFNVASSLGGVSVPAANLTKVGDGMVVLGGANSYTGQTFVNAGVLNIQNSNALGGAIAPSRPPQQLNDNPAEIQQLTVLGASGTFLLTFNGQTTVALDILSRTLASDIQTALNNLPTIGGVGGLVAVTQGTGSQNNVYTITFSGPLKNPALPYSPTTNPFTGTLAQSNVPQLVVTPSTGVTVVVKTIKDGPSGTVVNNGGTLQLQGAITVSNEPLTVYGTGAREVQVLTLAGTTAPVTLTFSTGGTGTITSNGTAVTGVGTSFTTQVAVGDMIGNAASGFATVTAIADDTHLTLDVTPPTPFTGSAFNVSSSTAPLTITTPGTGTITSAGTTVTGNGTRFLSQVQVGDQIGNASGFFTVTAVNSDTSLTLAAVPPAAFNNVAFFVMPSPIDLAQQFQTALNGLTTIANAGGVTVQPVGNTFAIVFSGINGVAAAQPLITATPGAVTVTMDRSGAPGALDVASVNNVPETDNWGQAITLGSSASVGAEGASTLVLQQALNQAQTITVTGQAGQLFTLTFTNPATGTITSNGTNVVGTGTAFTREVAVGDLIGNATSGFVRVTGIADDTHLAVASAPPNTPFVSSSFSTRATTASLNPGSSTLAQDIQNAINALPNVGPYGSVSVAPTLTTAPKTSVFTVTFQGNLASKVLLPGTLTSSVPGVATVAAGFGVTKGGTGTVKYSSVYTDPFTNLSLVSAGNSYTGLTQVNAGTLQLDKTAPSAVQYLYVSGTDTQVFTLSYTDAATGITKTTTPVTVGVGDDSAAIATALNAILPTGGTVSVTRLAGIAAIPASAGPPATPAIPGSAVYQVVFGGTLAQTAVSPIAITPANGNSTTEVQTVTVNPAAPATDKFTLSYSGTVRNPVPPIPTAQLTVGSATLASDIQKALNNILPPGSFVNVTRGTNSSVGNGTITSSGTTVTGVGTNFTTQVAVGNQIGNQASGFFTVTAIADDTHLTISAVPQTTFNGATYSILVPNNVYTIVFAGNLAGVDVNQLTISNSSDATIATVQDGGVVVLDYSAVAGATPMGSSIAILGNLNIGDNNQALGTGVITSSGVGVTGFGTHFLREVVPGDQIGNSDLGFFTVTSVISDTSLTLANAPTVPFANSSFSIRNHPVVQWLQDNQVNHLNVPGNPPASTVTVNADGLLDLNSHTETIGLTLPGLTTGGLFIVDGTATTDAHPHNTGAKPDGLLTLGTLNMVGGKLLSSGAQSQIVLKGNVTGTSSSVSALDSAFIEGPGTFSLGGADRTFFITKGPQVSDMVIDAVISDTGLGEGIKKDGNGRLTLNANNTFSGPSTIINGDLQVDGSVGAVQLKGGLASTAQIATTNGLTQTGSTVTVTLTTPQAQSLAVGETVTIAGAANTSYNGTFTIIKVLGPTQFQYTNLVTGLLNSGGGNVTLNPPGSLSGIGTVGAISDVSLSPLPITVVSPGDNGTANPVGELTAASATATPVVNWTPGTKFFVDLVDATMPMGIGADLLTVNGDINLGGATLDGTVAPGVQLGDQFVIIQTNGGSVSGTFAQPFGTNIAFVGGQKFTVDYSNPTQVVLTRARNTINSFTLASTHNPSPFGEAVKFIATIIPEPGATIPAGDTVTFTLDGSFTQQVPILNNQAVFDPTTATGSLLSVGDHTIVATFDNNDGTFNPIGTQSLVQTVSSATAATTITADLPNSKFGQPVTISITVAPSAGNTGIPQGTVTLTVDGTQLQPVPLDPANGEASQVLNGLGIGTHTVQATYSGDSSFVGGTSNTLTLMVAQDPTTTSLNSSLPNGAPLNTPVTFTATVTSTVPQAGTPDGVVTFTIDTRVAGLVTLDANGQAQFTTNTLTAGQHSVVVSYPGTAIFTASTSNTVVQVVKNGVTAVLTSNPNPSNLGQTVTFTATVRPNATGLPAPTGTVTFTVDGTVPAGGVVQLNSAGVATFSTAGLTSGQHNVVAMYGGDNNYAPQTSNTVVQTLPTTSTVTLAQDSGTSQFSAPATFTATVIPGGPTNGVSGTVSFTVDGVVQSPAVAVNSATNTATLTISNLAIGQHTVTAAFNGGGGVSASPASNSVTHQVTIANSQVTVNASANPSSQMQAVTFTATVTGQSPATGVPTTGTVTFTIDGSSVGTSNINSQGQATFTTSTLGVGPHQVQAVFSGNQQFLGSTSIPFAQNVSRGATVSVIPLFNPTRVGLAETFFVTVSGTPGVTPTGQVQFYIDGPAGDSRFLSDTETLDPTTGKAQFTTSGLTTGFHTLTVVYLGDTNYGPSSNTQFSQPSSGIVVVADTGTTLTSNMSNAPVGMPVTFTAVVTPTGTKKPDGNVNFILYALAPGSNILEVTGLATVALDANGVATYTTSSLPVNTLKVTAFYTGGSVFNGSAATVDQAVQGLAQRLVITANANPATVGTPFNLFATAINNQGQVASVLNGQQVILQVVSAPPGGGGVVGANPDPNQGAVATTVYQAGVASFLSLVPLKAGFYVVRIFDTFDQIFTDYAFTTVGRQT